MARVIVTMSSFDDCLFVCLFEAWSKAVSHTASHHALEATNLFSRPVASVIFYMLHDSIHHCKNA